MQTQTATIIRFLGGVSRAAEALSVHRNTVTYWLRRDNIPHRYRVAAKQILSERAANIR